MCIIPAYCRYRLSTKQPRDANIKESGAKAFFDNVKKFSRGGNKEESDAAAEGDDDGRRRLRWNSNELAGAVEVSC
jgi:hypothetical protein